MSHPDSDLACRWRHVCLLAWRMLCRDARAGELRLLLLALVVAVAAVASVALLSGRVGAALERDAARMLGADLVVDSGVPIASEWLIEAHRHGLATARIWQFPSMAAAGDAVQLAAVKAVEPGYPLRGVLRTAVALDAGDAPAGIPAPGTVWLDEALLTQLGIRLGDTLTLGEAHFRADRVIRFEPDRGMQFVNVAPRLLLHADDLPATGLTGAGSRVGYALHVAGDETAVHSYREWLAGRLEPGQRIADLESGRPEVRRAVDRAQRFLALVALVAVMVAALALAMAARRYVARRRTATAVMRALGATPTLIMRVVTVEFVWLALVGAALGCLLGWVAHSGLLALLGSLSGWLAEDLPAVGVTPVLQGMATGVWLLMGFVLPPLAQLRHVPPARVLQHGVGDVRVARRTVGWISRLLMWFTVALGFVLLAGWVAGEWWLGLMVVAGFMAAAAVFAGATALLLALLARLRQHRIITRVNPALRLTLAGLARRRAVTLAQTCALAIGIMALTLLAITRADLISGWQRSLPPDAPNRFVINIQSDQRDAVRTWLAQAGARDVVLYPMIRGRLIAVNDRIVGPDDYAGPRAKRLLDRDFNLSYADRIPAWNRVLAGTALNPDAAEVSLEAGLAATLALALGDRLRFDVAGNTVEVRVTSIRQVDWDSMQANFFALLTPAALAAYPQSWMTAFHLPDTHRHAIRELLRDFPNLTVFDVRAILEQVQHVLNQAVLAVQLLFVFTLAAGSLVLAAALASSRDERQAEAAVLRALGATRAQLARAHRLELLVTGALAGLLAAAGATVLAWGLATYVFEFAWAWRLWPWLAATLTGALTAWSVGALALRGVLRTPPWLMLREL